MDKIKLTPAMRKGMEAVASGKVCWWTGIDAHADGMHTLTLFALQERGLVDVVDRNPEKFSVTQDVILTEAGRAKCQAMGLEV